MILSSLLNNLKVVSMSEETYSAVKAAFAMFGTFMKDTAEEIGWEKTMKIRDLAAVRNGDYANEFFKTHNKETRLDEYGAHVASLQTPWGWEIDYDASPSELTMDIKVCPLFDGFLEAGMTVKEINAVCKSTHYALDRTLKKEFPEAEFTSVPKTSIEASCIERIKLPP